MRRPNEFLCFPCTDVARGTKKEQMKHIRVDNAGATYPSSSFLDVGTLRGKAFVAFYRRVKLAVAINNDESCNSHGMVISLQSNSPPTDSKQ